MMVQFLELSFILDTYRDYSTMSANSLHNYSAKQCPYWTDGNSNECKMTKGGLFLPMPDHISIFCTTSRFTQCHQYIRGEELLQETARRFGCVDEEGRRKYRRVADRFQLTLFSCDEDMNPAEILDDQAFTVDLSLGGIRLETRRHVQPPGVVAFTFGTDFSIPDLTGVGEIKWSEKNSDADRYQLGIEFADSKMRQAVGRYMGLPIM